MKVLKLSLVGVLFVFSLFFGGKGYATGGPDIEIDDSIVESNIKDSIVQAGEKNQVKIHHANIGGTEVGDIDIEGSQATASATGGNATGIGSNTNVIDNKFTSKTDVPPYPPRVEIPGFPGIPQEMIPLLPSQSPFELERIEFDLKELKLMANPSKVFGFLGANWKADFEIEVSPSAKRKPNKGKVYFYKNGREPNMAGYKKIGEVYGEAKRLKKRERQVLAATAIKAASEGGVIVIYKCYSIPVTEAKSLGLGGGTNIVGDNSSVIGIGGTGHGLSQKRGRAYAAIEYYALRQ